ncbi:hypothetical protein COCON_G00144320 [Conger conger]|uniref:Conotoxin n=1 Tax=Conger conger TaxID=82655 RepID=A0A9Q1DBH0_CONCO|nr:hypothetical protein COCON_G00144320 [Conger conger]
MFAVTTMWCVSSSPCLFILRVLTLDLLNVVQTCPFITCTQSSNKVVDTEPATDERL